MASIKALGGGAQFSGCFTIIMNRIVVLLLVLTGVIRRVIFWFYLYVERRADKSTSFLTFFGAKLLFRFGRQGTLSFFLGGLEFGSKLSAEIRELEYRANFDLGAAVKWGALEPLHGFLDGLHLPEPVAGDEFFGFGKRSVGHGALLPGKLHAFAFGAGM